MMMKTHNYFKSDLKTRSDGTDDKYIEGYFVVFNEETELWNNFYEKIACGAFDNSLSNNDIRCLFNHNTGTVLGRTGNNTLNLRADSHGLFGKVKINEADREAVDIYARVQRGDISGCSFGFETINEELVERGQNFLSIQRECNLIEVSVCTFPAYPQTEIKARQKAIEENSKEEFEVKKQRISRKLEEIKNGIKAT